MDLICSKVSIWLLASKMRVSKFSWCVLEVKPFKVKAAAQSFEGYGTALCAACFIWKLNPPCADSGILKWPQAKRKIQRAFSNHVWCIKPCSGVWHLIKPRAGLSLWSWSSNSSFHRTIKQAEVRGLLGYSVGSCLQRARVDPIVVFVFLQRSGLGRTDVRNSLKPLNLGMDTVR